MTSSLEVTAIGTVRVEGDEIAVYARHRQKPEKRYLVRRDIVQPHGLPPEQIDGASATVTWNLDANIVRVEVQVPEQGPVPLAAAKGKFLNPYGFVSIPDRDGLPEELRDETPVGHHRHRADRWTGTVGITITTHTPLLLPDHARAAANGTAAAALPVRVDHLCRPILAGSAVKGALRSAYEAITNSRLGVFEGHDQQLAIRAKADTNLTRLRPAYVVDTSAEGATLHVVASLEPTGPTPKLTEPVQTAVWVPRRLLCRCQGGCRCANRRGRRVEAWIYLAMLGKSPLWRVVGYAEPGKLQPRSAVAAPPDGPKDPKPVPGYPLVRVIGRLHWTGSTFPAGGNRKHDERMVVEEVLDGPADPDTPQVPVSRPLLDGWRAVISSYDRAHEHDRRRDARHYGGYVTHPDEWRELKRGDTLYVELDKDKPVGLYPAMIGRKPFPGAPEASLPAAHRPATQRDRLSPADRVFGWVRQGADDTGAAYRGQLRVLPPDDEGTPGRDAVETFDPLPLTVLNSPKPSQFRFYLGDAAGAPLRGVPREPDQGYSTEPGQRKLRGRKVYLTHAEVLAGQPGADEYWTPPPGRPRKAEPIDIGGRKRYREYDASAVASEAGDITTWISGWVKVGTTFRLTLQVSNLSSTELGALLWLLRLPDGAMLKLGLGKPLGFGAVRMKVDPAATRLFSGDHLRDRYRTLGLRPTPTDVDFDQVVNAYDALLREHLPDVRKEFLNAARGFEGAPVHYPRHGDEDQGPDVPATPRATTYDWWVANDKVGKGAQHALGSLADPESLPLPYQPSAGTSGSDGERGRGDAGRQRSSRGQRRSGGGHRR